MLKITPEQFAKLEQQRYERTLAKIIAFLHSQFLDSPSSGELRVHLLPMLAQVQEWGISSESFLALHVFASKVLGFDYVRKFALESVFSDREISDVLKEEWLSEWLGSIRNFDLRG